MATKGSEDSSSGKCGMWELSLYDQQRVPHEPITDESEIQFSPRSLQSELMCPICLDMLKNTMTAKECLHRFCAECITTALRSTNKECPTCRKKLVSKRSLRQDPNFDALIAKIYPDRAEYDAMQARDFVRFTKHNSTAALQQSIQEGMRTQAQIRRSRKGFFNSVSSSSFAPPSLENSFDGSGAFDGRSCSDVTPLKKRRRSCDSSNDPTASEASYVGEASQSYTQHEVELIMCPHPKLPAVANSVVGLCQNRYLKTTINATVTHLVKYLAIRSQLDGSQNSAESDLQRLETELPETQPEFDVFVLDGKKFEKLDQALTLRQMMSMYPRLKRPLTLYYGVGSPNPSSAKV